MTLYSLSSGAFIKLRIKTVTFFFLFFLFHVHSWQQIHLVSIVFISAPFKYYVNTQIVSIFKHPSKKGSSCLVADFSITKRNLCVFVRPAMMSQVRLLLSWHSGQMYLSPLHRTSIVISSFCDVMHCMVL